MYEIADQLDLDEKVAEKVHDPRKFNASTLERVIQNPKMREFLGIRFDENGEVVGSVHPDDFRAVYTRIVSDIASGTVDTRELNTTKGIKKYVRKLAPLKPKREGSFTSASLLGRSSTPARAVSSGGPSRKRTDRSSPYLISKSLKCRIPMPRIAEILQELQRLRVDGFENAVAVLLRIYIEMSISHYMESSGSMKPLVARLDKDGKKPAAWTPSFRQMLNDLLTNDKAVIAAIPKQALKALNKAVSDDDHPLSLDGMDQFVHNPYVAPTSRQLRQFWNSFDKLMQFLMEDHTPTPAEKASK